MKEEHVTNEFSIFNIIDYGAVSDGRTVCTEAINDAVKACEGKGGGIVFIPQGRFLTGPIELKSNVHLYLSSGSCLAFIDDPNAYPVVEARWEGSEGQVYMPMIFGEDINNVTISGYGTLDGQGSFWWKAFKEKQLPHPRPRLISFENSANIRIENISCIYSPSWTINPVRCSNVSIQGINIKNPSDSPNTDGINPDSCSNVRISNCHIDVGDDCIAIKSGVEKSSYRIPCENIAITNCTLVHGHGGVVIGSEMSGGVKNVVISNCVFQGTDRGIRLKTRRGRGGIVEDILVSNCIMENVLCPFVLNQYYFCGEGGKEPIVDDKNPHPVNLGTPIFRGIHLNQITAKKAGFAAAFIYGLPEMPISDISFSNISITLDSDALKGMPAMMDGIEPVNRRGIICNNTENISFSNVSIRQHEGPAFEINNSNDVSFYGCSSDKANFSLTGCKSATIDGNGL